MRLSLCRRTGFVLRWVAYQCQPRKPAKGGMASLTIYRANPDVGRKRKRSTI